MRRYRPAGGPIIVSILELPAPPKNVGQWTIRKGINSVLSLQVYIIYVWPHAHIHSPPQSLLRVLKCSYTLKSCPEPSSLPPAALNRELRQRMEWQHHQLLCQAVYNGLPLKSPWGVYKCMCSMENMHYVHVHVHVQIHTYVGIVYSYMYIIHVHVAYPNLLPPLSVSQHPTSSHLSHTWPSGMKTPTPGGLTESKMQQLTCVSGLSILTLCIMTHSYLLYRG